MPPWTLYLKMVSQAEGPFCPIVMITSTDGLQQRKNPARVCVNTCHEVGVMRHNRDNYVVTSVWAQYAAVQCRVVSIDNGKERHAVATDDHWQQQILKLPSRVETGKQHSTP